MLRRCRDKTGKTSWLNFSRRHEHGIYDSPQSGEDCTAIAREVKEYENAFLSQQISFLETIHEYFTVCGLQHDPVLLADRVQRLRQGVPVRMKVFPAEELEDYSDPD